MKIQFEPTKETIKDFGKLLRSNPNETPDTLLNRLIQDAAATTEPELERDELLDVVSKVSAFIVENHKPLQVGNVRDYLDIFPKESKMTDEEMYQYFKSLGKVLNALHDSLTDMEITSTRGWVSDTLRVVAKQIKRPSGLTLHSSSTAFEKEFHSFLKIWKSTINNNKIYYGDEDHRRFKALAGVYLRQLCRLYKEIGK